MLVLFDHGTPKGLARSLPEHTVHTAQSKGWNKLSNGALLDAAEEAGFELLLTADRRIPPAKPESPPHRPRRADAKWSLVRRHADRIATAVASATAGSYVEVEIPFEPKPA